MRKIIYFAGAFAIAVGAAYVWSYSTHVSSHNTASVIVIPHRAAAPEARPIASISPTEMMINNNKPLPVEQWDAF
jgi:hypothetical protein